MLITLPVSRLAEHGRGRPAAFVADVLAVAKREGDTLQFTSEQWSELVRKHRPGAADPAPRVAVCTTCEWARVDGPQRYCDHPSRNCAKLFPSALTESCPLNLWPMNTPIASTKTPNRVENPQSRRKGALSRLQDAGTRLDTAIEHLEKTLANLRQKRGALNERLGALATAAPSPEILTPPPASGDQAQVSADGGA